MNRATIRKGGMEINERERARGTQGTGRNAPRLQAIPGPRHSRESGDLLEAPMDTRFLPTKE